MGLPTKTTSSTLFPEKDFHAMLFEDLHKKEEIKTVNVSSVPLVKIKLPAPGAGLEEGEDGCSTPTPLDQNKNCPPAPRKPKSLPILSKKRRKEEVLLLDLSNEVESLFPPLLLKDLLNGKIKKLRKESCLT